MLFSLFVGMIVVATGQVATIKYLSWGITGTLIMPVMLTLLMKADEHKWSDPKILVLWASSILGIGLGTWLWFAKPILHK
jgi:hypothetical protein